MKNIKLADQVDTWDDKIFSDKVKITWILKDENNIEKDYEHYTPKVHVYIYELRQV